MNITKKELEDILDKKLEQRFGEYDKKMDQRFGEYDKKMDQRFGEYDKKLDQRFIENNQILLEAVDEKIKASEQRIVAGFEIFTDEIRGILKDVNSTSIDATELESRVNTTEIVLKTNVLPRLEILENAKI